MTLQQRITLLAQAIGGDVKSLTNMIGNLSALSTSNKTNIVAALNEIFVLANTGGASAVIDDAALSGTAKTYSIDKIKSQILDLKNELLGGVPATAYDTLKEIADYIANDVSGTAGIVSALGKRVSVDGVQTFSAAEKLQARQNIDAYGSVELGNPDTDLVVAYTNAKA